MSIREFCRADPCTASPSESVREAAKRMEARGVGSLVVVDAESRPVGMLTDRDVVVRLLRHRSNPDTKTVAEVMQRDPTTVHDSQQLVSALRRMRADGLRRLPVVAEDGRLVGLITADDALQLLASELSDVAGVVRAQFPSELSGERAIAPGGRA